MNNQEKLKKLIKEQKGTVLSSDLSKYEIPREYLSIMVAEGSLERVRRGVYVSTDAIEDEIYALQNKYPKIIYSHETALYIHGLTDRTPFIYSVTVPSGYKVVDTLSDQCKVFYIKANLHMLGVMEEESPHGNPIKVYTIERTMCDLLRRKDRIDIQIFSEALKRFSKLESIDFNLLMNYSRKLKVEQLVRTYMEVLL